MHDVSLRAASNLMDSHNLAVVLCPTLVAGSNALRDVSMCSIPGGGVMSDLANPNPLILNDDKTTLGMVIKLCIQRYYEVFDDVRDRSEAVPQHDPSLGDDEGSEIPSGSGTLHETQEVQNDDDDEIDDAILVMPIGPGRHNAASEEQNVVTSSPSQDAFGTTAMTYKPRQRRGGSKFDVRSIDSMIGEKAQGNNNGTSSYPYPPMNRSKSLISIENIGGVGMAGRKGSITVGRGTTKKSSGAGVEAISITAEGFFTPPSSSPPVSFRKS
jgi:Rho GTPase-activating protein 1